MNLPTLITVPQYGGFITINLSNVTFMDWYDDGSCRIIAGHDATMMLAPRGAQTLRQLLNAAGYTIPLAAKATDATPQ